MAYTFEQLKDAVASCTSFDLISVYDEDEECDAYYLMDGCGDQYGDAFYELADVEDYITNNEQVDDYLYETYGVEE